MWLQGIRSAMEVRDLEGDGFLNKKEWCSGCDKLLERLQTLLRYKTKIMLSQHVT